MDMARPATQEAYIKLVNQSLMDVDDLRSSIKHDEESMGGAMDVIVTLENNLKSLYASLIGNSYQFADEDLDYIETINKAPDIWLPFKPLLQLINQTHRQGLESD